jgi:hypothetical protein
MVAYVLFLAAAIRRAIIAYRAGRKDMIALARLVGCALFVIGGSYNPVALVISVNTIFFFIVLGGARAVRSVDRGLSPAPALSRSTASRLRRIDGGTRTLPERLGDAKIAPVDFSDKCMGAADNA